MIGVVAYVIVKVIEILRYKEVQTSERGCQKEYRPTPATEGIVTYCL